MSKRPQPPQAISASGKPVSKKPRSSAVSKAASSVAGPSPKAIQTAPTHYEGLVNLITSNYPFLSGRFQQAARFLTQNPNVVALASISAIADKSGVHASGLVRFSQSLGYRGFKELQSVFQTRLATAAPGFHERINAIELDLKRNQDHSNLGFLRDLVVRDIATMQGMLEGISEETMQRATTRLHEARVVFICGQLRSEPIASFLRYVLTMLKKPVVLLDPAGGLAQEMAATIQPEDALILISFRHYAKETVTVSEMAAAIGVPVIAITDSQLSPISRSVDVLFCIPEEEYSFSRSLAAPMSLAQALAVSLAAFQQSDAKPPRIPTVTERERRRDKNAN